MHKRLYANAIAEKTTPTSPNNPEATFTIASLLVLEVPAAVPVLVPLLLPALLPLGFDVLVGPPANPV
jgi:hypothetical protein